MAAHAISALFGFLGGALPGSIHFAWKVSRNNNHSSGTIDLTYRAPQRKKKL